VNNSQFIHWLRTLRREDLPAFREFLELPGNRGKRLPIALFEYLFAFEGEWRDPASLSSARLREGTIFAHLYPDESEVRPQRLRRVMMELRALIEQFGASRANSFIRPELDAELRTLRYLLERNSPLFLDRLEDLFRRMETMELSQDLPLARMWMEQMRVEYRIHRQSSELTLEQSLDYLDEFYLQVKLETWTSMRNREFQFKQNYRYPFKAEIDRIATDLSTSKPMVALWRAIFAMVSTEDAPHLFQEALAALEVVKRQLNKQVLRQVRGYLFNALMRTRQNDNRAFFLTLHELLDTMLHEGTLHLPDGRMSHPFCFSYVRAACMSGHAPKAAIFLQAQTQYLVSPDIAGLIGYCEALTQYYAGHAKESWRQLLSLRSHDLRTEAYLRILQVQVAYALAYEDDFFRLNETLRKFLERHPALGERFLALVKRFTQFSDSIARVRFGWNAAPSTLRSRLQKAETAEKLWLLEQVDAMPK
jgi:hypothetical protein